MNWHARLRQGPAPDPSGREAAALIGPDDPPPFTLVNADGRRPILLVCDHASRAVPRALGALGLDDAALSRHIGWDIGAAELTLRLAHRLDAPAVLGGYSRLVIDLNRQPGDPQSILAASDGIVVPGNAALSAAAQEARAEALHWPYHHAVDQAFARLRREGPEPLIEILREADGLQVGDNQPYSGKEIAYTLNLHAGSAGLAHCAIEVRQDHCESAGGLDRFADLLAGALQRILAMPNVHRVEEF